jgi:hypothetical protein
MWWINPDEPPEIPEQIEIDYGKKFCYHDWKKTVLIISIVEDCTKCGIKKEDWEV